MTLRMTNVMLLLIVLLWSCGSGENTGNNSPSLDLRGLDKDEMQQGLTGDLIIATLAFEDLDGDILGGRDSRNIYIVDNRDASFDIVSFPELPEVSGAQTGVLRLELLTTCCINPTSNPCEPDTQNPTNQYTYDIYIVDGAGNESNRVTTPEITLYCD